MSKLKNFTGKCKKQKGAALAEVLIAMFIFTVGLTSSSALISMSIKLNLVNEQRIQAVNLAREGVEAVRNMRDTNWLSWSANMRECWNYHDNTNNDAIVDVNDEPCIANDDKQNDNPFLGSSDFNYIVDLDDNYRWVMIDHTKLAASISTYSTRLYKNANGLFTHDPSGGNETLFSRSIRISYIDSDDKITFPEGEPVNDNRILIESKVSWGFGGRNYEVILAETLTDYLGRTSWLD